MQARARNRISAALATTAMLAIVARSAAVRWPGLTQGRLASHDVGGMPTALTAPGRYEATVLGVHAGQRLLRAQLHDDGQTPPRLAAEAVGQVSVPYPSELAPDQLGADPAWLAGLSPETGTHAGPLGPILTTPGAPRGTRTRPVWPEVLWALVLPLLLIDLLLRRVALGRPARGRLG